MYVSICVHAHVRVYLQLNLCAYMCIYVYMRMYVYTYNWTTKKVKFMAARPFFTTLGDDAQKRRCHKCGNLEEHV